MTSRSDPRNHPIVREVRRAVLKGAHPKFLLVEPPAVLWLRPGYVRVENGVIQVKPFACSKRPWIGLHAVAAETSRILTWTYRGDLRWAHRWLDWSELPVGRQDWRTPWKASQCAIVPKKELVAALMGCGALLAALSSVATARDRLDAMGVRVIRERQPFWLEAALEWLERA